MAGLVEEVEEDGVEGKAEEEVEEEGVEGWEAPIGVLWIWLFFECDSISLTMLENSLLPAGMGWDGGRERGRDRRGRGGGGGLVLRSHIYGHTKASTGNDMIVFQFIHLDASVCQLNSSAVPWRVSLIYCSVHHACMGGREGERERT